MFSFLALRQVPEYDFTGAMAMKWFSTSIFELCNGHNEYK